FRPLAAGAMSGCRRRPGVAPSPLRAAGIRRSCFWRRRCCPLRRTPSCPAENSDKCSSHTEAAAAHPTPGSGFSRDVREAQSCTCLGSRSSHQKQRVKGSAVSRGALARHLALFGKISYDLCFISVLLPAVYAVHTPLTFFLREPRSKDSKKFRNFSRGNRGSHGF